MQAFIEVHHNNWDEYLTTLEFTYNDSIQANINHSPFFVNSNQYPIMLATFHCFIDTSNLIIEEFIQWLTMALQEAWHHLFTVQN